MFFELTFSSVRYKGYSIMLILKDIPATYIPLIKGRLVNGGNGHGMATNTTTSGSPNHVNMVLNFT